jgi:hypothetical protein
MHQKLGDITDIRYTFSTQQAKQDIARHSKTLYVLRYHNLVFVGLVKLRF